MMAMMAMMARMARMATRSARTYPSAASRKDGVGCGAAAILLLLLVATDTAIAQLDQFGPGVAQLDQLLDLDLYDLDGPAAVTQTWRVRG